MSKNKIILQCPEGPCASEATALTTDVVVEVREAGVFAATPLDLSAIEVTLTRTGEGARAATSMAQGTHGEVVAKFVAVPQGWYRALAVRRAKGEIEASAARRAQIIKLKGASQETPQPIVLTLSKQGVARFVFVTENELPLKNTGVIMRHPDGNEQRHTTNGIGEIRLGGATGDVFSFVRFEHPAEHGVISAEHQEGA
jgi:hypothetical protein